jgi:hypothetical protein
MEAKLMDQKKFRDEIEATLLNGAQLMLTTVLRPIIGAPALTEEQLRVLCRERANNIATAYTGRVLAEPGDDHCCSVCNEDESKAPE